MIIVAIITNCHLWGYLASFELKKELITKKAKAPFGTTTSGEILHWFLSQLKYNFLFICVSFQNCDISTFFLKAHATPGVNYPQNGPKIPKKFDLYINFRFSHKMSGSLQITSTSGRCLKELMGISNQKQYGGGVFSFKLTWNMVNFVLQKTQL